MEFNIILPVYTDFQKKLNNLLNCLSKYMFHNTLPDYHFLLLYRSNRGRQMGQPKLDHKLCIQNPKGKTY